MAAALDTLRTDIDAAERAVRVADQRAANTGRALRASWRAKGPPLWEQRARRCFYGRC